MSMKRTWSLLLVVSLIVSILSGCFGPTDEPVETIPVQRPGVQTSVTETESESEIGTETESSTDTSSEEGGEDDSGVDALDPSSLPVYSGTPYVVVNGNMPRFSEDELTTEAYEFYSPLDALGRCGAALASCGREIMPAEDEERGSISSVYPSGWEQAKYDWVSGKYLYNRSHLIGWQLSAENANRSNLITGTRYMNVEGMLPFENMVADYIRETGNHVAYRVTPIFVGDELVCRGVQIEAYSIEDEGEGICFNVYCYNVQPGVLIDYATGVSQADTGSSDDETTIADTESDTVGDAEEDTSSMYGEFESRDLGEFDDFDDFE